MLSPKDKFQYRLTMIVWLIIFFILLLGVIMPLISILKDDGDIVFLTFIVVASSGGLGGVMISLIENNNRIRFLEFPPESPDKLIDLDFISEVFLGVVAAIVFYYFLFQFTKLNPSGDGVITIISISILSGISGRFLLIAATNKFNKPLFKSVVKQGVDIEVHYLFNRALSYLSNNKPYSALTITKRCKIVAPEFNPSYHLESLCYLEYIKMMFINDGDGLKNKGEIDDCFKKARDNIKDGLNVARRSISDNDRIRMIEFGYSLRKINICLHELAVENSAYDFNKGINFEKINDSDGFSKAINELKSIVKDYVGGKDEARKYVKEELYELYDFIS